MKEHPRQSAAELWTTNPRLPREPQAITDPENPMVELKKNLLSVALLSALSMAAASAHAQDAQQTDAEKKEEAAKSLDTVVVTGIRGSIERSIEAKQDASTMVEAISA